VVFVDAGGLSPNWGDFGFSSPDIALGLGLRFNLPVGPVRLEYGHNMTKDEGEPSGTWQFAIGIAF
jgi:outer membrane protein assembly factor BamA